MTEIKTRAFGWCLSDTMRVADIEERLMITNQTGNSSGRICGGKGRLWRMRAGICAVAVACALALTWSSQAAARGACAAGEIRTASGCTDFAAASAELTEIVNRTAEAGGVRGAIVRVDVGNRTLAVVTPGESMAGVPTSPRMHFRLGSMAIPYLTTLMLQLYDEGELSLEDPLSNWFPDLPNAEQVTLRMLAQSTSGYPDWIQGNPAFVEELFANPFRQWTTRELLDVAFSQEVKCAPAACRFYAHTNFILLGKVLQKITGQPLATLLRKRVLEPLGLRQTQISALPDMPEPVLHAYVAYRGFYEDSTFWSPSWTIAKSLVMSGTAADVIRSAQALGTGATISPEASRERFAPNTATAGYPGFSEDFYYGLGVVIADSWQLQTPQLNGYNGVQGYLPSRRIAFAVVATNGLDAAAENSDNSRRLVAAITEYLTPDRVVALP